VSTPTEDHIARSDINVNRIDAIPFSGNIPLSILVFFSVSVTIFSLSLSSCLVYAFEVLSTGCLIDYAAWDASKQS
jgi:hypothetical protein